MKGQSAIEYLFSYGWMLLVVAIIAGSFFTVAQDRQINSITGFNGDEIDVEDFGITSSNELKMSIQNRGPEEIEINSINISNGQNYSKIPVNKEISPTGQKTVNLTQVNRTNSQEEVGIEINYDSGELENVQTSGTVSGGFQVSNPANENNQEETEISTAHSTAPENLEKIHDNMEYKNGAYLIEDDQDLQAINHSLNADYRLKNDINATLTDQWNSGAGFKPLGEIDRFNEGPKFKGTLYGNNKEIIGLEIDREEDDYVGLFERTNRSTIKNLEMTEVNITGNGGLGEPGVGALAGHNKGNITNVNIKGNVTAKDSQAGLIAGTNRGRISGSTAKGKVTGPRFIGLLAGVNNAGTIKNSYAEGEAKGKTVVGGIVGASGVDGPALINNSNANVTVIGNDQSSNLPFNSIGGLTAYNNDGTIDNSYATGKVVSRQTGKSAGGLVGENRDTVINSYSKAQVQSQGVRAGGLAGWNRGGTINNSYATGNVNGTERIGGAVGYNSYANVNRIHATGNVTGTKDVGGLIGRNTEAETKESYATGDVNGGEVLGGLVGWNQNSNITNTYATGDVNGDNYVGGLVNYNWKGSRIEKSFATGNVTAKDNQAGLVEYNAESTVTQSYWDNQTTTQTTSQGGTPLKTDQMQGQSATENMQLDFNEKWGTQTDPDGYPQLSYQE